MIRYSHVALLIPLSEPSGREVSEHLGVAPTLVRESKGHQSGPDGLLVPSTSHTWQLDSKKDASHQPVARIEALLDEVALFSERLLSLDPKFERWVDMVFHVTPQHPHGVSGEFDWLSLPHQTMGRLSRFQLSLSYESSGLTIQTGTSLGTKSSFVSSEKRSPTSRYSQRPCWAVADLKR